MNILELIKLAFKNILSFKLRSFLTMLGIIIGVSSVILISSIGAGFKNSLFNDVTKEVSKILVVSINELMQEKVPFKRDYLFTEESLNELEKLPNVKSAFYNSDFVYGEIKTYPYQSNVEEVFGVNVEKSTKKSDENIPRKYLLGNEISEDDYKFGNNVAIIDNKSAEKLFGQMANAIGKELSIDINGVKTNVVIKGIMERLPGQLGNWISIKIPMKYFGQDNSMKRSIMIKLKDTKRSKETIEIIKNFYFNKSKIKDLYKVEQVSEQIQEITGVLDKISLFISFIAGISLIVGGIGVMNIMLVSVTERISEIGLRKAIGAKNRDILIQFLIEAIILTLTGGLIGVIFGYSISLIIGHFIEVMPILEKKALLSSVFISISIGLIFGIFPAKKASKLLPIEALRKE